MDRRRLVRQARSSRGYKPQVPIQLSISSTRVCIPQDYEDGFALVGHFKTLREGDNHHVAEERSCGNKLNSSQLGDHALGDVPRHVSQYHSSCG